MRKKRNSTRVNMTISVVFHSVIVVALFYFAAREGLLGKQMKKITAELVQREKQPEKPKEKPPEQKPPEQPKTEKPTEMAKTMAAPPPPVAANVAPPAAVATAPAATIAADFDFSGGEKTIQNVVTDPVMVYKNMVEFQIKQKWLRPDNIADQNYVAEIEVAIDNKGKIVGNDWKHGSGDKKWDDSVRKALAQTQAISQPPPKGFPTKFLVRFDVEVENAPILSASLQ